MSYGADLSEEEAIALLSLRLSPSETLRRRGTEPPGASLKDAVAALLLLDEPKKLTRHMTARVRTAHVRPPHVLLATPMHANVDSSFFASVALLHSVYGLWDPHIKGLEVGDFDSLDHHTRQLVAGRVGALLARGGDTAREILTMIRAAIEVAGIVRVAPGTDGEPVRLAACLQTDTGAVGRGLGPRGPSLQLAHPIVSGVGVTETEEEQDPWLTALLTGAFRIPVVVGQGTPSSSRSSSSSSRTTRVTGGIMHMEAMTFGKESQFSGFRLWRIRRSPDHPTDLTPVVTGAHGWDPSAGCSSLDLDPHPDHCLSLDPGSDVDVDVDVDPAPPKPPLEIAFEVLPPEHRTHGVPLQFYPVVHTAFADPRFVTALDSITASWPPENTQLPQNTQDRSGGPLCDDAALTLQLLESSMAQALRKDAGEDEDILPPSLHVLH